MSEEEESLEDVGEEVSSSLPHTPPLGIKAAEFMNAGLLVPDDLTIEIILHKLCNVSSKQGFMLDGFPRTLSQAQALNTQLDQRSMTIDAVIFINVEESELLKRLSSRYICEDCQTPHNMNECPNSNNNCAKCSGHLYQREDDKPEAVSKRIQIYHNETVPVLEYYKRQNVLHDISGIGPVDQININILNSLKYLYDKSSSRGSQVEQTGVE